MLIPAYSHIFIFADFFKVLTKWADEYRSNGGFAMYMGWSPTLLVYNVRDLEVTIYK